MRTRRDSVRRVAPRLHQTLQEGKASNRHGVSGRELQALALRAAQQLQVGAEHGHVVRGPLERAERLEASKVKNWCCSTAEGENS